MTGKASAKQILRSAMRAKLRALTPAARDAQSARLRAKLTFAPGQRVALFAGLPTEPDLLPLLASFPETRWFLPRVTGKTSMEFYRSDASSPLRPGPFGIPEPTSGEAASTIETFLCPGLAFTRDGHRLGQGGGYYDRFLLKHPAAQFIGIAFDFQLVTEIPRDPHDLVMHRVITSSPAGPAEMAESTP